jgi:hypothetical protein
MPLSQKQLAPAPTGSTTPPGEWAPQFENLCNNTFWTRTYVPVCPVSLWGSSPHDRSSLLHNNWIGGPIPRTDYCVTIGSEIIVETHFSESGLGSHYCRNDLGDMAWTACSGYSGDEGLKVVMEPGHYSPSSDQLASGPCLEAVEQRSYLYNVTLTSSLMLSSDVCLDFPSILRT